ncbi:hypothetical protein E8E14_004599 [Neopestalotiopsis sp. 37M]|nr:hypothetical protein E8E14_004599 [Neopestalotiopsis sp. 37M]
MAASKSFDELIAEQISPQADGIPSVALLATRKSGTPYIYKTAGVQSTISNEPVNPDSAWWMYSITKTLTAISALQCVERGLITLDDEEIVHELIPELSELSIISLDQAQNMTFTRPTRKITLRQLLSHTSGVGMDMFDPRLKTWRIMRGEKPSALCGKSLQAYAAPLVFEPGLGWAYGGSAEFAGILVERLSGMKLGEYMKENIFDPLGMKSSTFHPDLEPEIQQRLVEVSTRISDGSLVPGLPLFPLVTEDDSGAMGLVSTLSDMTKLTTDLLQDTPKVLTQASIEELCRSQFEPKSPPAADLEHAYMMYGRLIGEPYDAEKVGHGLGAFLIKKDTNVFPGGTLTMTGLPNLVWFINRKRGIGGLYASAVLPPDDAKSGEIIQAFIREAFNRAL